MLTGDVAEVIQVYHSLAKEFLWTVHYVKCNFVQWDYCTNCLGLWLGEGKFNELVKQPNT